MTAITITVSRTEAKSWNHLTQSGVKVPALIGGSVIEFLTDQLGFDDDYISTRVMTIFIDGKPVDDLYSAKLPADARIALGAMAPGVAGLTMCRNNLLSGLRSTITYENTTSPPVEKGTVTLALFNAIMTDKGADILEKGVTIPACNLSRPVKEAPQSIKSITVDGAPLSIGELEHWIQKNPQLQIQLRVELA